MLDLQVSCISLYANCDGSLHNDCETDVAQVSDIVAGVVTET